MTQLRCESLTIPGAPLGDENPLPFFRDPRVNLEIKAHASLPDNKREYLGWETAFRVLPYRMQDNYTRTRIPLTFRSIILENEFLTATFLPELGGRLISLIYRPQNRELLHRNPVFQPANLAIRNAWFSGGIEWNVGQYGHTFTTCSPVFAAAICDAQGEPGLRLYEYERCKGLFWQIDLYLPADFPFLVAYTRVINPNNHATSMYWWTNVAIDERPGVRVLAPAQQAIYVAFETTGTSFGLTDMPHLPSLDNADGTYSLNATFANEFFFQCDTNLPWEAALDKNGEGFIEASTQRLKYRKLFCWGTHPGGRHWQEFLAEPREAYLEIQAGLAPSQVHGLPMPAHSSWDWTQAFGYIEADPKLVHSKAWNSAIQHVDTILQGKLSHGELIRIEADCRIRADKPSKVILQIASGWGALESIRRKQFTNEVESPAGLIFPEASLGKEQHKWLNLLMNGDFPDQSPTELPGEWMVQSQWEQLLETSHKNWYTWLHLGVMRLERFDEVGAETAWLESICIKPSCWAYRNLAILSLRRNDPKQARKYYELAWQLAEESGTLSAAFTIEYLQKLAETEQWQRGMDVYQKLPPAVQSAERIQILRGKFALALGDLDSVEEVLNREYAIVREGETILSDLWFELQAQLHGVSLRDAKQKFSPPSQIDFRSIA